MEKFWDKVLESDSETESVEMTVKSDSVACAQSIKNELEDKNDPLCKSNGENDCITEVEDKLYSAEHENYVANNEQNYQKIPVFSFSKVQEQMIADHRRNKAFKKMQDEQREDAREEVAAYHIGRLYANLTTLSIIPLENTATVDADFPAYVFPDRAQMWIREMSEAFYVHPGVAGSMLLGVTSIASRGKFKVKRHENHLEICTLYLIILMSSGKLKSPMIEAAMKPVHALEKEAQDIYHNDQRKNSIERDLYKKAIAKLKNKAAKYGNIKELAAEIMEIEDKIPAEKHLPLLTTFKFTPEGLDKMMLQQNGRLSIVGAELGSFKKLPGNRDDLLLSSWSGEPYVFDKAGESVRIASPCLAIMLATQEKTALKLLDNPIFQEDGLIGRFTYLVPPDLPNIFPEQGATDEVPVGSETWLDSIVREMFAVSRPEAGFYELPIEDGALKDWELYSAKIRGQVQSEETSLVLKTYYRKLAGTALRFSGLLHVLKALDSGQPFECALDRKTVNAGIELAQYYEKHARVALDVESGETLAMAHKIIAVLKDWPDTEVPVREIYRKKHWTPGDVMPGLELLQAHNFVALYKDGKSTRCLINPRLRAYGQ